MPYESIMCEELTMPEFCNCNKVAAAAESYEASGPTADPGHSQDLNPPKQAGLLKFENFAQQQIIVEN